MKSIETLYSQLEEAIPTHRTTLEMANQQEQQEAFLAGDIDEPRHIYPFLQKANFDDRSRQVETLGHQLIEITRDSPAATAYQEKVEQKHREIAWLRLCQQVVHQHSEGPSTDVGDEIHQHTSFLHGGFEEPIFNQLITDFWLSTDDALNSNTDTGVDIQRIHGELEELLGDVPAVNNVLPQADQQILNFIADKANELFGGALSSLPQEGPALNPQALLHIFESCLHHINLGNGKDTPAWTVALDDARLAIGPDASTNQLLIPSKRHPQPANKLGNLVAHELWHVVRTMNGQLSGEPILKHGTAGYMDMEEGSAVALEAAASGALRFSGEIHYLGIGLLIRGFSFRKAHDALWRYRALNGEPVTDEDIQNYKHGAYRVLRRATRGTDHYPMHKDLSYVNGVVKAINVLRKALVEPKEFEMLAAGRADQTLPTDRELLQFKVS